MAAANTSPTQESARAIDNSVELLQLRKEKLLPYAQATVGALKNADGAPERKPLKPDISQLTETLGVSRTWIYRKVAWFAKHLADIDTPGFESNFRIEASDGGKGGTRFPAQVRNLAREYIINACVEVKLKSRSRRAISHVLQRLKAAQASPLPTRPTIAEWMTADLEEFAQHHANGLTHVRVGASAAIMDLVYLDCTQMRDCDEPLVGVTTLKTNPLELDTVGILNLFSGVEAATLIPWGWLWFCGKPETAFASECIYHGLLTKRIQYSHFKSVPSLAGKPGRILVRPGLKISPELEEAVHRFSGRIESATPAQAPDVLRDAVLAMYRGFVRYLRTQDEIRDLRESVPSPQSHHTYVLCKDLTRYWVRWLAEVFTCKKHPFLGKSPRELYDKIAPKLPSGQPCPECRTEVEDSKAELKWYFWKRELRKVNHMGIQIASRFYSDDSAEYGKDILSPLFAPGQRTSKGDIEIRRSYIDLNHVLIRHKSDDTPVKILLKPRFKGENPNIDCSEWEWQKKRERVRQRNLAANSESQPPAQATPPLVHEASSLDSRPEATPESQTMPRPVAATARPDESTSTTARPVVRPRQHGSAPPPRRFNASTLHYNRYARL